ncbi:hypothetical protein [Arsenicicoccus sp. oral taxon 190]|uniref:hypothetical protein n=1 Tax=Arsenicicoccus sp. oral taxon 190 TaxID=1658671 RepID=UPI0012E275F5|nr:hypothetical protein [Arsenicicoccus sp. oral taxon 190]
MGNLGPGDGRTRRGGTAWRPTLALASLGVGSTAVLAALSLSTGTLGGAHGSAGAPPSRALAQAATAADDLASASSAGAPGTLAARPDRVRAVPLIVQQPQRTEATDPDTSLDIALPSILSAAPRGQVLEQVVFDPAERRLAALRDVAPVIQVAAPLTGLSGDSLLGALVRAAQLVPAGVDPGGATPLEQSPLIALAAPAPTLTLMMAPAEPGTDLAAGPGAWPGTPSSPPDVPSPTNPDPGDWLRRAHEPDPEPTTPAPTDPTSGAPTTGGSAPAPAPPSPTGPSTPTSPAPGESTTPSTPTPTAAPTSTVTASPTPGVSPQPSPTTQPRGETTPSPTSGAPAAGSGAGGAGSGASGAGGGAASAIPAGPTAQTTGTTTGTATPPAPARTSTP